MTSKTLIKAGLKAVITNLVTNTQIAVVYDYYEPNISSYPAIAFDIVSDRDSYLTNKENKSTINFRAYIIVNMTGRTLSTATVVLDSVTDSLMTELRKESNMSLGGIVDYIEPVTSTKGEGESPSGTILVQTVDIMVVDTGLVN